jgi:signal transduction histidine kinase
MGNLMNVIRTIPHLVGESTSDSPLAQMMDIATHSGQQMHDLIDSMLDVSRLEQREVPLNRTRGQVENLLRSVGDQFSTMAESRQIELSIEMQDRLPVLWADQDMIRRVLANLVSNAIKYSPREERIEIVAGEHEGCIQFSVSDHGAGIPPHYQWRIFDKFARVQQEGAPKGVGLGLAFCRLAVEAHGGLIWVDSVPGQGSTFSFTLPVTEPIQSPYPFTLEGAEEDEEPDNND